MNYRLAFGRLLYWGPMISLPLFILTVAFHVEGWPGVGALLVGFAIVSVFFGITSLGIKIVVDEQQKNKN